MGGRGGEAFGWTETYLFVCLTGKRAYILNLSPIERKVREKWQFSLFGWGERGGEAFGWTETYLFLYLIGKRAYISNLGPIKHKVREILQFSLLGWGEGEVKPSGGLKLTYLYALQVKELTF